MMTGWFFIFSLTRWSEIFCFHIFLCGRLRRLPLPCNHVSFSRVKRGRIRIQLTRS
jgi:hypothetical protein